MGTGGVDMSRLRALALPSPGAQGSAGRALRPQEGWAQLVILPCSLLVPWLSWQHLFAHTLNLTHVCFQTSPAPGDQRKPCFPGSLATGKSDKESQHHDLKC